MIKFKLTYLKKKRILRWTYNILPQISQYAKQNFPRKGLGKRMFLDFLLPASFFWGWAVWLYFHQLLPRRWLFVFSFQLLKAGKKKKMSDVRGGLASNSQGVKSSSLYALVDYISRWWCQILLIFTPTWGNDPI